MEKILEVKEFLTDKKFYIIGGIIFLLLLGCSIYFCYHQLNETEKEISFFEEKQLEEETKEEECYINVDIKGAVNFPNLYLVKCNSRVQDVINLAGGITANGDTSILNLGKKVEDEMVIIVYSKQEVENFMTTKEEENTKIESCINQLEIKNDACMNNNNIINSTIDEIIDSGSEIIGDTPVKVLISINHGTKEELMTLSGIGESKANSIINYRNQYGGFKTLEEIKNVKGIGDSIFVKIKDNITL